MMYRHGLRACSLRPNIDERGRASYWCEPSKIRRDSEGFRASTCTPQGLSGSTRGSAGKFLIAPTGGVSTPL